jgi:hypothetical protein
MSALDPRAVQVNLIILDSLPGFQEELEKSTRDTEVKLEALPKEASKDPQTEISTLLHGFVTDLVKLVEGVPNKDGLLQSIRPAHEDFRSEIRGTAPEFLPFERRFVGVKKMEKARFLTHEEGEAREGGDIVDVGDEHCNAGIICIDEVFKLAHE